MDITIELLKILSPEILLMVSGFLILGVSLFRPQGNYEKLLTSVGSLIVMVSAQVSVKPGGLFQMIPLLAMVKIIFVILNIFFIFSATREDYGEFKAEFFALMQFATAGFMLLASSTNLMTIFLSLEFASICLYALVAVRADRKQVVEAAFKYFTFGASASAFLIFGMSLLYGMTAQLELSAIRLAFTQTPPDTLILGIAMVFILVGFGFKLAVAPFHFWAPDVYQMAPLPVVGLLASISNYSCFLALSRILYVGLEQFAGKAALSVSSIQLLPGWGLILCLFIIASIFVGNFTALNQIHFRRFMAYSAVAQSVFVLVAMVAFGIHGLAAVFEYNLAYALATAGIFLSLKYAGDSGDMIEGLGVIRAKSVPLAVCLSIFLLSLAGVPPFVGFFAKLYVFVAALLSPVYQTSGLLWLVILALAASVVGFYYYLRIVKVLWVDRPVDGYQQKIAIRQIVPVIILAALIILLGLMPQLWLHFVQQSIVSFLW